MRAHVQALELSNHVYVRSVIRQLLTRNRHAERNCCISNAYWNNGEFSSLLYSQRRTV